MSSFKDLINRAGDRANKEQKNLINGAVKRMGKSQKQFDTKSAKMIKAGKKKAG